MTGTPRLPARAYTDPDWFAAEQRTLFARSWVFLGLVSDFAEAGDYRTITTAGGSVAALRGKDGTLAAFHNVCRHRGLELLDGPSGTAGGAIVCPYHRWTYGLDGSLRGVPDRAACFPDLDRAALGLKPASVGVFNGLVFVNPDPQADFAAFIDPLAGRAWPHRLEDADLKEASPLTYDLKCDWKVFIENAIDGYHLAYLHEHTLGGPVPSENLWERAGDHLIWFANEEGIRHRLPAKIRKDAAGAPKVRSAAEPGYGGVYHLFPATLVVPTPYGLSISALRPVAVGRCRMDVRHFVGPWQSRDERKYIPGWDKKTDVISSDNWTAPPLESGDFQTEDVYVCEKVQRGLASPAYEHGPLSVGPGAEDPIRWFHETLAEKGMTCGPWG